MGNTEEQGGGEKQKQTPGERLEELLHELRYTQTALARKCDVSPQYVNNIIRGRQRVTEDFAQVLAEELDVNLNWLYLGQGAMIQVEEKQADETLEGDLWKAADSLHAAADRLARERRQKAE